MKNFSIFIISIIFSLFLCEILLRYVFVNDHLRLRVDANQKQFKDSQKLTWNSKLKSFKPNSIGEVNHPEYQYKIKHDKIGFRNPCLSNKKNNINNIIIGDSFVYGVGVEDTDTLNCKIDEDNYTLGVPNSAAKCYVDLLNNHYSKLKKTFDLNGVLNIHVILYFGNDFESLVDFKTSGGCPSNSINEVNYNKTGYINKFNYLITRGFLSNFYLPQIPKILYKNFLNNKKYKNFNSINENYFLDNGNDTFYTDINYINQNKLKKSLEILNENFKKIDNKNFNILFYLMPSGSDISKERLVRKSKISGFNHILVDTNLKYSSVMKYCNELDLNCYDLRKFFTDTNFYYHDTHLNKQGVRILSKIIDKNIKNFNKKSF